MILSMLIASIFSMHHVYPEAAPSLKVTVNQIQLYVSKTCPYCHKVIDALKKAGKLDQVTIIYVGNENYAAFFALSGKDQVPFLYDSVNNVKMFESLQIIKYLLANLA